MTTMAEVEEYLDHHGIKGMKWGVRRDPKTGVRPAAQALNNSAFGRSSQRNVDRHDTRVSNRSAKKAAQQERADWLKKSNSGETATKVYNDAVKSFGPTLKKLNKDPMFADIGVNRASRQQYDAVVQTIFNQHLLESSIANTTNRAGDRAIIYQMTPDGMHMRAAEYRAEHDALSEAPEFELIRDDQGFIVDIRVSEPSVLMQSDIDMVNEYVEHHGVRGMRWGVRRKNPSGPGSKGKTTYQKQPKRLSDAELNRRIKRMELEKKYSDLSSPDKSAGKKYAHSLLENSGRTIVGGVVGTATAFFVGRALKSKFG